jgi:GNAT superfamily N-acetyltransferase
MSGALTLSIALASGEDEEDLVRLLSAQFREHDIELDEPALRRAVRGPVLDRTRGAFLIARDGAEVLGFAYVAYTWTLEHGGKSAWLEELYVVPDRRGRGIGTHILRTALDLARGAGCAAVDLEVDHEHARAARLYEREGFRAHRRARWFLKL